MGPPLRCSLDKIAKRIEFPVDFIDHPLAGIESISREEAVLAFGEPHLRDVIDGLGETDLWAYECDCGLQISIARFFFNDSASIDSNRPEPDHIERHLRTCGVKVDKADDEYVSKWISFSAKCDLIADEQLYRRELTDWQLWRQDDNGNRFAIGLPTSEIDARCRARQLESLGHKQTYWVERIARS